MSAFLSGIPEADWLETPASVRALINAQQPEIELLRGQLTPLATEMAILRERIGRSSRNSYKPPSSDGLGFKQPERRKGTGRKRGGQQGHTGRVGRNCCRSSGWMRWWITTLMPAAVAVCCLTVLIQNPCAIR